MNNIILIMLLGLLVIGCGSIEELSIKDQSQTKNHEETASKATQEPEQSLNCPTKTTKPASTADETPTEISNAGPTVWVSESSNWWDAINNVHAGYKLPSRAELIALIDNGELGDMRFTIDTVWTSTELDNGLAWRLALHDGYGHQTDKQSIANVFYIKKEADHE